MDFLKFHPRFSGNRDSGANLKKVLALVLAFACAFTMFAGAAFTDQADIKVDDEVVNTLVSLGVVQGFEDGSFQPNGTVTRAQMAKMIYVLRTGNSDASAYNDDKTSFTDINGHWARGYIKYCQSLNIIAGKSSTIFAPNANVTAQEAAKMLLVTLGYDANKAGLVGTNWAAKTNALADENGLLEDVNTSFTGPCPRQYAAQLIYNTLDANTVVWRDDAYTNVNVIGGKNQTVGQKYMGLMDTDDSILLSVKEDSKGTFTVKALANDDVVTFTKVAKDYTDLLGQKVDVLAKASDKVYGIYATSDNELAVKSTVGDLDKLKTDTLKIDGTEYDIAAGAKIFTTSVATSRANNVDSIAAGTAYSTTAFDSMDTANTVYAVSNDEDEKIDLFVVIPAHVAKVTNVSSSSVVLSGIGSIDTDDYVAYEGLKKNDYVLYIKDNDGTAYKDTLSKVDVVNATVDGVKNGDEFRINGTYYKAGTGVSKTPKAGDKVEAALYGSRFYSMDINAATSVEDMLVVYAAGARMGGVATGAEAKVVFSDGTKSTINVTKIVDPKDSSFEYDVDQNVTIKLANAADIGDTYTGKETKDGTGKVTAYTAGLAVGALYTYEKDGSDYKLTPVTADNDAGFDDINAVSNTAYVKNNDRATLGSNRIDDAATIFVVEKLGGINDSDADAKVITGKSLSSWSNAWGTYAQTATNTNNGVKTVMAGVVADISNGYGVNDDTYGIVNSDVVRVYGADGKRYYQFKLWNGSADETVYTKNAGLDKGDVVTFDDDDKVGDIRVLKTTVKTGADAALLGVDGKYVTVAATPYTSAVSKEYKVTDDTSVLFIEDDKAVAGTVADLNSYKATETSNDNVFVPNMKYILNNAGTEFEMIIVDVRGYLSALDNDIVYNAPAAKVTGYTASTKTVTLSADETAANIATAFKNVLTAKRVDDSHVLLVSTKGDELTLTVTGGKVTA